jgi:hypothetical protein
MDNLYVKAVWSIRKDGKFSVGNDYASLQWLDDSQSKPSKSEFNEAVIKVQAEYDAQAYARNRASAYDSVGDQLDMMMKDMRDGTTTHQTACEAVKAKYPKPS